MRVRIFSNTVLATLETQINTFIINNTSSIASQQMIFDGTNYVVTLIYAP